MKPDITTILFLDTENGYSSADPIATLVEIHTDLPIEFLIHNLNKVESPDGRNGSNFRTILASLGFEYHVVSKGKKSDNLKADYTYKLIAGNY